MKTTNEVSEVAMNGLLRHGSWEIVRPLGKGGQGTVYIARKIEGARTPIGGATATGSTALVFSALRDLLPLLQQSAFDLADVSDTNVRTCEVAIARLLDALAKTLQEPTLGALKIRGNRDAASPRRFEREIDFLRTHTGPTFLRLLDADPSCAWYVSELHVGGSMDGAWASINPCFGSLEMAWTLLRPVAVAVAGLHEHGVVHRDIKAKNMFIAADGRLVLGDPGIALSQKDDRLTAPLENVASWPWAPLWARQGRIKGPDPTHDVFSIVKLLWAMIAGRLDDTANGQFMPDDKWRHPEYDLQKIFAGHGPPRFKLLSDHIFARALVDRHEDCAIKDAKALVTALDAVVADTRKSLCPYCGSGLLEAVHDSKSLRQIPVVRFVQVNMQHPALDAIVSRCPECLRLALQQKV